MKTIHALSSGEKNEWMLKKMVGTEMISYLCSCLTLFFKYNYILMEKKVAIVQSCDG